MTSAVAPEDRTELRLALVCYGGVSLAVYMHGITKELHKLVRASRRFDAAQSLEEDNPFRADETESAYYEALRELAETGHPLTVSIDVIAGTSAGGINGVVLAKVLAVDGDQDGLKKLWIEEADLRKLLRGLPVGPLPVRAALAAFQLLTAVAKKTPALDPPSPLKGELLSRLLHQAIRGMDPKTQGTLLPRGGSLDLYVTLTDLGGFEVLVPTGAGGASQRDRQHAQVLHFSATDGDPADLANGTEADLAFAARATASFPGAFAPVSLASFAGEVGIDVAQLRKAGRFVSDYSENGTDAAHSWFVDGGVLDNGPFDLVIRSIAEKRAERQVLRRMIYIQPDPDPPLVDGDGSGAAAVETPSYAGALWRVTTEVKGSHSVLRDLLDLRNLNTRISQVGAIAEGQNEAVLKTVGEVMDTVGATPSWTLTDKDDVTLVSDRVHEEAKKRLGVSFSTYGRLKMEAAARRLADEIATRLVYPPDSGRTSFVRAAVGAWARGTDEWRESETGADAVATWLRPIDLPYRERRLHFLLSGVNALYTEVGGQAGGPTREDLNALKREAWNQLDQLRSAPAAAVGGIAPEDFAFLNRPDIDRYLLQDPARFATDHQAEFATLFTAYSTAIGATLGDGSSSLWAAFAARTTTWRGEYQRALLARYFGFPLWDGLIFPTIALSELPQFTPIGVAQFSPPVAKALKPLGTDKLKGIPLHHFAGFADANSRSNDYLWGRLDAVELILRTLFGAASPLSSEAATAPPEDEKEAVATAGGKILQDGLRAVLDSENGLTGIDDTMASLHEQVKALLADATIQVPTQRESAESKRSSSTETIR